jgi:hypothetical protein
MPATFDTAAVAAADVAAATGTAMTAGTDVAACTAAGAAVAAGLLVLHLVTSVSSCIGSRSASTTITVYLLEARSALFVDWIFNTTKAIKGRSAIFCTNCFVKLVGEIERAPR